MDTQGTKYEAHIQRELNQLRIQEFQVKLQALCDEFFGNHGYNIKANKDTQFRQLRPGLFVMDHFAGELKDARPSRLVDKVMGTTRDEKEYDKTDQEVTS